MSRRDLIGGEHLDDDDEDYESIFVLTYKLMDKISARLSYLLINDDVEPNGTSTSTQMAPDVLLTSRKYTTTTIRKRKKKKENAQEETTSSTVR